jgi:hypothetical protein
MGGLKNFRGCGFSDDGRNRPSKRLASPARRRTFGDARRMTWFLPLWFITWFADFRTADAGASRQNTVLD